MSLGKGCCRLALPVGNIKPAIAVASDANGIDSLSPVTHTMSYFGDRSREAVHAAILAAAVSQRCQRCGAACHARHSDCGTAAATATAPELLVRQPGSLRLRLQFTESFRASSGSPNEIHRL